METQKKVQLAVDAKLSCQVVGVKRSMVSTTFTKEETNH